MCGRYRLSRRKQLVEEYFDSVSDEPDWTPRFNVAPTQPFPIIRQHPKEPRPRIVADALGTYSVMGKRPFGCGKNDKCEVGDSKLEARVPRFSEISQVLDSRRRILRMGADGQIQAAVLF